MYMIPYLHLYNTSNDGHLAIPVSGTKQFVLVQFPHVIVNPWLLLPRFFVSQVIFDLGDLLGSWSGFHTLVDIADPTILLHPVLPQL